MRFISFLKKIKKSLDPYQPLITVKIFRKNILHNLRAFQTAYPKLRFAPVLKSNAYGHGLAEVASILDDEQLPFFMVDSLFEARALRHAGIKTPTLTLGFTTTENINGCKMKNVSFGITSLEQLQSINAGLRHTANFHLKIDTGMARQGLSIDDVTDAIHIIKNNHLIQIVGLCSHLADADGDDDTFTRRQIALWNEISSRLETELGPIEYKHLANTAGSAFTDDINANIGRLGIGLYGYNTSRAKLDLRPALEIESVISSVRVLKAGNPIGYNKTFTARRDLTVATVPVGYAEGVDRRLSGLGSTTLDNLGRDGSGLGEVSGRDGSNCGCFTINGVVCPIVGRISMNITSIDVSQTANPHLKQPVTIVSANSSLPNSIENMAKLCLTIPYDILVHIPAYLYRVIK